MKIENFKVEPNLYKNTAFHCAWYLESLELESTATAVPAVHNYSSGQRLLVGCSLRNQTIAIESLDPDDEIRTILQATNWFLHFVTFKFH